MKVAEHPCGSSARELLGVGILGGIGFSVSIYIADAGFNAQYLRQSAVLGVFAGSLLATISGAIYFRKLTSNQMSC